MAYAIVQSAVANSDSSIATYTATFGAGITAGNCVVLFSCMQAGDRTTRGAVASTGATWAGIGAAPIDDAPNTFAIDRFYAMNHPGGGVTNVVYTPNTAASGGVIAVEISGIATTSALDAIAGQLQATPTTGTDSTTSGAASVAAQPALILGACFNGGFSGTPAAGTGFTNVATWATLFGTTVGRVEHKRVTSTGSQSATFTAAGNTAHLSVMVTLLEPAVAGGSAGKFRSLLGAG